jgi:signal peptidase
MFGAGLVVLVVAFWLAALRPTSLGGPVTYLLIRGNSMEPTYHGGDLVLVRVAAQYAIGDIVAYRVPAGDIGAGHIVIHRISGGVASTGFLMRGDNNPSVDPWMPRPTDIVGVAWFAAPGFGRLLAFLHQPATLASLAVATLAAVAAGRQLRGFAPIRRPARTSRLRARP